MINNSNYYWFILKKGEYRVNFKSMVHCNTIQNSYKIKMYNYLSKITADRVEMKGNTTCLSPVDDSLDVNNGINTFYVQPIAIYL